MIYSDFKVYYKLLLISLVISLTGCGEFLKGKSKKQEIVKVEMVEEKCAQGLGQKISKIMSSESSQSEIDDVFSCIDSYLKKFHDKVDGESKANEYGAQDLSYIADRFFKDLDLDKKAIDEILKLKTVLVGGSSTILTKKEVSSLRKFIQVLKGEVTLLSSDLKVLNIKTESNQQGLEKYYSQQEIDQFLMNLNVSLKVLLANSKITDSEYSYQDFKNLLTALKVLDEKNEKTIKLLDSLKAVMTGQYVLKTQLDFNEAINNLTDAAKIYLYSKYDHVKYDLTSISSVAGVVDFSEKVHSFLLNTIQFKRNNQISLNDIDHLLLSLFENDLLPFDVQFETFKNLYRTAIKRILSENSDKQIEFIQSEHLARYKKEIELIRLHLAFMKELFKAGNNYAIFEKNQIRLLFNDFIKNKSVAVVDKEYSHAFKVEIINTFVDLNIDWYTTYPSIIKNKKYFISTEINTYLNETDFLRGFYTKMLSRLLLLGWGNAKSIARYKNSFLTVKQMMLFKKEFRPIAIEMKLMDPRSKSDGSDDFLEANLFTFSSNGDDKMSLMETNSYVNYLFAEGSWVVDEIREDMRKNKCDLAEKDVFGNNWMSEPCFIITMKKNYAKYFANKPNLVKYLSQLSYDQFLEYHYMMVSVSRYYEQNKGIRIETSDIQKYVVISSYVESFFSQFDQNKSGSLSADEIRMAYPRFKAFAVDYTNKYAKDSLEKWGSKMNHCQLFYNQEDLIRESFIYKVLNKGINPGLSDLNYVTCSVNGLYTFKNELDQKSIIYTFLVLKSVLASTE